MLQKHFQIDAEIALVRRPAVVTTRSTPLALGTLPKFVGEVGEKKPPRIRS